MLIIDLGDSIDSVNIVIVLLGAFCESAQFVKCSTCFVNSLKVQIFIKTCAIYRSYMRKLTICKSDVFQYFCYLVQHCLVFYNSY